MTTDPDTRDERDKVARSQRCGEASADAEVFAGLGAEPAAAVLALLTAARPRGLRRWKNLHSTIVHTSTAPHEGWYPRSSWDARAVDWAKGGPWSVEFVERVTSLGLIAVCPHDSADTAKITTAGRAALKRAVPARAGLLRPQDETTTTGGEEQ